MKQGIRIIGGKHKGRKLAIPDISGLRPTPSRIRETLFNWLMATISDSYCLDAFAGSGALGFEAYSRGAAKVVFIEQSTPVFKLLAQQIIHFNSPQLCAINANAYAYLKKKNTPFNIIFLDPPFADKRIDECILAIEQSNILLKGGFVYLETPEEIGLNPSRWEKIKLKHSGQVVYGLYKRI